MNTYRRADNGSGCGTHTCRLTFMKQNYRGHVTFPLGGNCRGGTILDAALNYFLNPGRFESDCYLTYAGENSYSITLHRGSFRFHIGDISYQELFNMIVAVEIIDYKPEKE